MALTACLSGPDRMMAARAADAMRASLILYTKIVRWPVCVWPALAGRDGGSFTARPARAALLPIAFRQLQVRPVRGRGACAGNMLPHSESGGGGRGGGLPVPAVLFQLSACVVRC